MKLYTQMIVKENERGLLYQNGLFQGLLDPGKHSVYPFRGQSVDCVHAEGLVKARVAPKLLLREKSFADSVTAVNVADGQLAMHYVDGRINGALPPGEYFFWSVHQTHTFWMLDLSSPEAEGVSAETFLYIPMKHYTKVEVLEGECALLYFDGSFQRVLESGTHYFWNSGVKVTAQKVDLRVQQMEIPGQEILTADKVALRLNFVCSYRITDPVRIVGEIKSFAEQIYGAVQLALRKYVGGFRLDELLDQKGEIADVLLEKLRSRQQSLYVEFLDAGLKDIILPGDIRSIMNTVLIAEKSAQANVISRREETASTRSLLNTAKLLDENETLRHLKELEYLERICDKVGSISVSQTGGLIGQLQELITVK